jgi:uncharacterized protein (TIGR02996 family)
MSARVYVRMERAGIGDQDHFWEVEVRDQTLWTRTGHLGSDGHSSEPTVYSDAESARAEAVRRVVEQYQLGFREIAHVIGEPARNPDIEATILSDPDSPSGYLVYADWLQAHGDPRGELIMLDYRLEKKTHDAPLLRARRRFEKTHRERLLPERLYEMQRGTSRYPGHACEFERRYGFLYRARLGRADSEVRYTVRELLLALLHHPSAALLQELHIGAVVPTGASHPDAGIDDLAALHARDRGLEYDYQPVVAALSRAAPASLRRLTLADPDRYESERYVSRLGSVDGLFTSLPALTDLHLCAYELEIAHIQAPVLRCFQLSTPILRPEFLDAFDRATWPHLEELRLCGNDHALDIGALARLLSGKPTPELSTLAITQTRDTGEILHALMRSPLITRLRSLDLSYGDLSDNDVAAMGEHADAFRALRELSLDGNLISRAARADVREVCPNASLANQRGAAADRPRFRTQDIIDFAPDVPSIPAARDVADSSHWPRIGTWGRFLWGRYQGRDMYDVFVEVRTAQDMEAGCTCPSYKYPCKHALGLLMLAESRRILPVVEPPVGFIENCRAHRS